jgi:hypothetical protein
VNLAFFFSDKRWRIERWRLPSIPVRQLLNREDSTMSRRLGLRFGSGFEKLEDRCTPAHFVVNTAQDSADANIGDGKALDANNNTSLRAIIQETNNNPLTGNWQTTRHDVMFAVNLISLDFPLPELKSNFMFTGGGVTIERNPNAAAQFRLFLIPKDTETHFSEVNLRGGRSGVNAGAIQNRGALWLEYCNVYDNQASQYGGAISSDDTATQLTIVTCSFWSNSTVTMGGAIYAAGQTRLLISNTDIFANSATGTDPDPNMFQGLGGGVFINTEDATVAPRIEENTRIYGNTAGNNGGGLYVLDTSLSMSGGEIHGNTAYGNGLSFYGGWGGGIYVDAVNKTVTLSQVKLTNNAAGTTGGGGYVWKGTLQLQNLTHFSGNTAQESIDGVGYKQGATATLNPDPPPAGFQMIELDP